MFGYFNFVHMMLTAAAFVLTMFALLLEGRFVKGEKSPLIFKIGFVLSCIVPVVNLCTVSYSVSYLTHFLFCKTKYSLKYFLFEVMFKK